MLKPLPAARAWAPCRAAGAGVEGALLPLGAADLAEESLARGAEQHRVAEVDDLLDAAFQYAETTKRRVSIEYALMRDINDQADRAAVLARQLRRRGDWNWAHVNLIPLNPTPGSRWTASRQEDQDAFVATLERWKIPVTVRDTRGSDIDGACGQLAAKGRVDELGV